MRKGAADAGAIFLVVDRLDGTSDFYAPAPQSFFDDSRPADRLFERVVDGASAPDIAERIERETRFDPDIWIVAVEDRQGRAFLELD